MKHIEKTIVGMMVMGWAAWGVWLYLTNHPVLLAGLTNH